MATPESVDDDPVGRTDAAVTLTVGSLVAILGMNGFGFGLALGSSSLLMLVVTVIMSAVLLFAGWWFAVNGLVAVVKIALRETSYSQ